MNHSGGDNPYVRRRAGILLFLTLALLVLIYIPTLLTHINGGDDPYMDDVGEIQVALNVWGTIHHTGYPVFTILGNLTTIGLRALGVDPAVGPGLYAMAWGLVALTAFYLMVLRLTRRAEIAAVTTLLLGLTRTVWIHNVVSEVYSMSFAFQVILLTIALWEPVTSANVRSRVWLLALVGGIGVAHHRMVFFMTPGLLLAVWPGLRAEFSTQPRRALVTLAAALPIGLIGFVPYLYLPARAWANAAWVYGDPRTLVGFWHEFTGAEAAFLMQLPVDGQAWLNDILDTFRILASELTVPFAIGGGLALLWSAFAKRSHFRREAQIALACTPGYFVFLIALHRVVMPEAVAMPVVMVIVLGLALAFDEIVAFIIARLILVLDWWPRPYPNLLPSWRVAKRLWIVFDFAILWIRSLLQHSPRSAKRLWFAVGFTILAVLLLIPAHSEFIYRLTHNRTGLDMIELAKRVPRDEGKAVMMMPWGPRFDAIAFSKYVTGENADLRIVDHKADFGALSAQGDILYTSKDTFYRFPLAWWDQQIGRAYLTSPDYGLVAIRRAPMLSNGDTPIVTDVAYDIVMQILDICEAEGNIRVKIVWSTHKDSSKPDLSVFVHLLNAEGSVISQADSSAPVNGWYPTSRWTQSGEAITDDYVLPRLPDGVAIKLGMYEQPSPGQFVNHGVVQRSLDGVPRCK